MDIGEPGMDVGMTALTEKWSSGCRGRSNGLESRHPGPTLSPAHRATMSSKSPALLGLGLIHKMGLITHYLLYKMIGKMNEIGKKIFFLGEATVNKLISDCLFIILFRFLQ